MFNIAIVGGGPAGIFCAIMLLKISNIFKITVFDPLPLLSTLLPTGNGRCNLAYGEFDFKNLASNYPRGEKFLYSIFSRFQTADTLSCFEDIGVKTYMQNDFRIFPKCNSAAFVRNKMLYYIKDSISVEKIRVTEPLSGFDAVVLSTGLKSGAGLAKKYGHTIIPLKPALCGLKIKEKEYSNLEGVSFNGVLFTKYGVSGPLIYKYSSINAYREFPYSISIPLLSKEKLSEYIDKNPKKLLRTVISEFVPKSLAKILVKDDIQCANASKKMLESLTCLNLTVTGTDGRGEIVHAGGVSLDEIDKNLKSKIVPNLWIIGELLNIDGFTGGFNLQNCWSTSAVAAFDIAERFNVLR